MQTRLGSFAEAIIGTIIGLAIALVVQGILYWVLGIPVSFNQNLFITLVMTVVSVLRSYWIRRLFVSGIPVRVWNAILRIN